MWTALGWGPAQSPAEAVCCAVLPVGSWDAAAVRKSGQEGGVPRLSFSGTSETSVQEDREGMFMTSHDPPIASNKHTVSGGLFHWSRCFSRFRQTWWGWSLQHSVPHCVVRFAIWRKPCQRQLRSDHIRTIFTTFDHQWVVGTGEPIPNERFLAFVFCYMEIGSHWPWWPAEIQQGHGAPRKAGDWSPAEHVQGAAEVLLLVDWNVLRSDIDWHRGYPEAPRSAKFFARNMFQHGDLQLGPIIDWSG